MSMFAFFVMFPFFAEILKSPAEMVYNDHITFEYEGHHFTDEIPAEQQRKRKEKANYG
ncbi:MAG: hypothetical protein J6D53_11155 [Blautia sp.]|nr:hypothetical protein [Blautia sp.]